MKRFLKSPAFMIVLFAVLAVAATAAVLVGVLTHEEPGFASSDSKWGHIPLSVTCVEYGSEVSDPEVCDVVRGVISVINSRLDFTVLVYEIYESDESDIHFTMNAPVDVGSSNLCSEPGECFELTGFWTEYDRCEVQTMNVAGAANLQWLVTYHGFGHCLGLLHDDYEQSIMNPVQRPTPSGTIPPWISDWDRNILRERYLE